MDTKWYAVCFQYTSKIHFIQNVMIILLKYSWSPPEKYGNCTYNLFNLNFIPHRREGSSVFSSLYPEENVYILCILCRGVESIWSQSRRGSGAYKTLFHVLWELHLHRREINNFKINSFVKCFLNDLFQYFPLPSSLCWMMRNLSVNAVF